jgi:uncharacterized protein (TIGR03437 family)
LQPVFPAFFTSDNYVAAVRSDGTIITSTTAAKPGDMLSLYGNGFGPTNPVIAPGRVGQTEAPLTNNVTITIGGVAARTTFSGLSATGLYQFNITVPTLPTGDHEVIATVAGQRTKAGVLLKVQP